MDDDDEDFRELFFTECGDLLGDLQEHLVSLQDGVGDAETINAAFRAVHSVKGGAAAFGFDQLIKFAHTFEAVMDLGRSGSLELSEDICQLLLRAGDIMETLIDQARTDTDDEIPNYARVLAELEAYANGGSAPDGVTEEPAPEATPAPEEPSMPETREVRVLFIPGDEFYESGHDIIKVVRAAKEYDLVSAEPIGDIPEIVQFTLDTCPVSWQFKFETDRPIADLKGFFDAYEAASTYELETDDQEPAPEPVAVEVEPKKPKKEVKPAPAADKSKAGDSASKSLRVEIGRVDRLVNLVGEIAITQAALAQRFSESEDAYDAELETTIESLSRQTRDLQESVMAIRAQPVKVVFSRMPRVVRDLCDKLEKKVRLDLEGEQTEVDTTIIEELSEPLVHMLRNSMDHGLETPEERVAAGKPETGVINLKAEHRGERVIITVSDDGAGINRDVVLQKAFEKGLIEQDEKLAPEEIDNLIFHPGFSTAESVSSVSGRGVGMDVVRKKIVELGGRCMLKSEPGKGCVFTIALPLTLAVLDGMTISVGTERFILPLSNVVEATFLRDGDVRKLPDNSRVLARRGQYLRLLSVRNALGVPEGNSPEEMAIIVDTETDGHVALLVDDLVGQRQVVLKSIETNYRRIEGVSGATILGDGRVALILDIPSLVTLPNAGPFKPVEMVH